MKSRLCDCLAIVASRSAAGQKSVGQTVMMLADDKTGRSKEEIKKKFPLAEWRREIIEGSDATAKGEDHNQDYDSDGKRNSVDHVLGMSEKCGEVIRNTGIEISDVIERIFRQLRWVSRVIRK